MHVGRLVHIYHSRILSVGKLLQGIKIRSGAALTGPKNQIFWHKSNISVG